MTAIQTRALCSAASMATAAKTTGVPFDPLGNDDMGYIIVKVYQDSASAVTRPSTDSFVEIHGSLDNSTWAVLARLNMSSGQTEPKDFYSPDTALGTNGGYISSCAILQLMPYMRVSYPVLTNAKITAFVAEA
jgi:hypothetical protein